LHSYGEVALCANLRELESNGSLTQGESTMEIDPKLYEILENYFILTNILLTISKIQFVINGLRIYLIIKLNEENMQIPDISTFIALTIRLIQTKNHIVLD
jgi:hypothetical protein